MEFDVSVVIPVYNAGTYLCDCLESIIASAVFDRTEIILVDDGSNDNSPEICDSYSEKYPNIKTFHIENGGVSNARNIGIENSSGKYVTFCDADDYYINDILCAALNQLNKKEFDLLFYNLRYEQEEFVQTINYPFKKDVELDKSFIRSQIAEFMLKSATFNSSCNKFYKKTVLDDIRFKKGQKHGEDRDFVLNFLIRCESAYYLPIEGYFYRYVKQSAVNKPRFDYFDNIYNELLFRLEIYKNFDIPQEKLKLLCEQSAAQQIVSCTFSAAYVCDFLNFKKTLDILYNNKVLMDVFKKCYDESFFNDSSYKKTAEFLLDKKTFKIFVFTKYLTFKEKVYKILKKES